MPLKDGPIETFALNPFWTQAKEHGLTALSTLFDRYLAPFGSATRVDIARKKQNMERFLKTAMTHTVYCWSQYSEARAEENEDDGNA